MPYTMVTTVPHELHRSRRGAIAPFFSTKSVRSLVDVIWVSIEKLCARLEKSRQQDAVPIRLAFEALTTDIITDYAMGQCNDLIESPDFALDWHDTLVGLSEFAHISLHMNWAFQLVNTLPERVVSWINPKANLAFKYRTV